MKSDQLTLFNTDNQREVWEPAEQFAALGATLRAWPIYLGTSSWTFPGWAGLVYPPEMDRARLRRDGLAQYARFPMFRAAGVDRTFYGPMTAGQFAAYARQLPDDFRLVVKAQRELTTPSGQLPAEARSDSDRFLDAVFAQRAIIEPLLESLGHKAAGIVFQFPPLRRRWLVEPQRFLDRLHGFLVALSGEVPCFVEIRNHVLYGPAYFAALQSAGARHCFTVHPGAPTIAEQRAVAGGTLGNLLLIRWNLRRDRRYEEARHAFAPFDQLVAEDPDTREDIADLIVAATAAGASSFVLANNKAEGSAPLTLAKLAEALTMRLQTRGAAPP